MRDLGEMTWTELDALDRERAVFLLPVGATEAHGPHLPLATDVIIADAMARAGAETLDEAGLDPVLMPPVAYTSAGFAGAFAGTVSVRPEAVTAALEDTVRSLARHGFRTLAIANAHLDPEHLSSLHAAVEAVRPIRVFSDRGARSGEAPPADGDAEVADGGRTVPFQIVFPDITRRAWALRLTEEFRSGACHAGRYETSIVQAARPELVREEIRRGLDPVPASLVTAIREGRTSFADSGGPDAYFGWPADASPAEGEDTIRVLGGILAEALLASIRRPGHPAP